MSNPKTSRGARLPVSMEDVARVAHVAISTVSRVLSGGKLAELISRSTAARVRRAAQQLRYVPNIGAKMLRSRSSPFVAVIGGHFTDMFSNKLRNALDLHLRRHDLVPLHIPYDANEERAVKSLQLAQATGARRFIILSSMPKWPTAILNEVRHMMIGGVAVGFGPKLTGFSSVEIDEMQAAASAVEHLAGLSHRRLCVLDGSQNYEQFRVRSRIWRATARRLGMRVEPLPPESPEISVCRTHWSALLRRCTAAITYDDNSAFKLLQVAQSDGIRVPAQLSIIGFDDIELAGDCFPGLTTIRQPVDEMAEHAIRLILSGRTTRVILKTTLAVRQSTALAPR